MIKPHGDFKVGSEGIFSPYIHRHIQLLS